MDLRWDGCVGDYLQRNLPQKSRTDFACFGFEGWFSKLGLDQSINGHRGFVRRRLKGGWRRFIAGGFDGAFFDHVFTKETVFGELWATVVKPLPSNPVSMLNHDSFAFLSNITNAPHVERLTFIE